MLLKVKSLIIILIRLSITFFEPHSFAQTFFFPDGSSASESILINAVLPYLIDEILDSIEGMNDASKQRQKELALSLSEVQKKIDTIEEKYFLKREMMKETYEKFTQKPSKEKD